ncbi:hypothetical protein GYM67_04035 [Bifidobacterium asteroides]|uniref:hypothetical protein n=1 Tax=Bifidobacterium asteroides TaxID=1684 RepID=UPI001C6A8C6F|nr:hypothetical protein [Bifidobacterium asteroides]QYN60324.1 hypothetical protein GYM67_04035 [Bifidobacterium asteroides]
MSKRCESPKGEDMNGRRVRGEACMCLAADEQWAADADRQALQRDMMTPARSTPVRFKDARS